MGLLQCEKTQRRDTAVAVKSYSELLNEHLIILISINPDGTRAVVQWSDDFSRFDTKKVFVGEEDRSQKLKVTMGAANVLPNIRAPRIEEGKPFDNPEFLTPSATSPTALNLFNQHSGHWLDKLIKKDKMFTDTAQTELPIINIAHDDVAQAAGGPLVASTAKNEEKRYYTKQVIREHIQENVLYNKCSENTLMRKHDHNALIQVSDHPFISFENFATSQLRMICEPALWGYAANNYLQVAVSDKPANFAQKMLTNQIRFGSLHFGNLLQHASPENFALVIKNNPSSFPPAMSLDEQKSVIGKAVSKTMQLGGSLHVMLHLVDTASTNWHAILIGPLFAAAAGLIKAPEKLALPSAKFMIEAINACWCELRDVGIPALQQVNRFDSHALLSFLENEVPLCCILYDTFLKNGQSEQYYHGLAHVLVCATKSCRYNYMTNTYRMLDQKGYLDRVGHDARCFVNDEALASNCEGFGEGHFNLIASQLCRAHNNNFTKAKDAIFQHFYNDMDGDLSNFKRRVLPLDSAKGGASVDRIDNVICIATKLITDLITRIVEAPESEWPTPRPDLKGRQHSNKSTCPWLVPTFCNQATKPTVATKANISVEVDIPNNITSSKEVESNTTFVTMKEDAVKDIIRINTTEVPSVPMTVTVDEVLLVLGGSKRPIKLDAAQYTEHSPKILKTNNDCVDLMFMVPAAKETSAPSQAEDRIAKSDTFERKCTTQMQAAVTEETVTEEKLPVKSAPVKKKTKATKDPTLFWSHAQGALAYALFPDGYNGQQNAPHNRVSAIGCNYPNCSSLPESKLCKLKCGHTACSQCIALKPAFTNDLMQAVGCSKKPRRSPRRSAAVEAKKLKIEYIDDEAVPAVNEFQGCSLCNSKLMQRWAKLAAVDIKSQGRKLTIADIKKNGGNYVDYEHEHKESIPKLGNDSSDADSSTEDDEDVDKSSAEVDSELASLLQNVPRKPQRKGEEMILESKSRLRQLIK